MLAVGRGEHRLEAIAGGGDLLATAEALQSLRDLGLVQAGARLRGRAHLRGSRDRLRRGRGEAPPAPDAPERAPAGGPRFRPTATWQEVPPGTAVPPGGEYRMELGGKVFARWPAAPRRPPPEARPGQAPCWETRSWSSRPCTSRPIASSVFISR